VEKQEQVLVTGAAGFIGFHLSGFLCEQGYRVTGLDNLNAYYDVNLKLSRLDQLKVLPNFNFHQADISNKDELSALCSKYRFDYIINLAAQAGVRYSIENPYAYVQSNVNGFLNVLEASRQLKVKHLVYASSSSVYGANKKLPFSVHDNVDHPLSMYAATKKSNELMAHSYSSLFGLPTTGLRFFTVYGPYGRPDMALFLFTKAILEGKPIDVFNQGRMKRDFTYVGDIVQSIARLLPIHASANPEWNGLDPDPSTSFAPYAIYNIGNHSPVELNSFIDAIENKLGKKALRNLLPLQSGDVPETFADVQDLEDTIGFRPSTSIETGIGKFIDWYLDYYNVSMR
jgi:UDP-glucuronate 4-epimerase